MNQKTLGEHRVRTSFNPSEQSVVESIKQKSADLIDILQAVKADHAADGVTPIDGEFARLCSLAQTAYEEAAMWAVKAATWKKEEITQTAHVN